MNEDKRDLDRAVFYYDEDALCLRCDEEKAVSGEDLCIYCLDLIKHKNRDRFQPEDTY